MAGGYVAYYYTNTAWDVIRPEETPPGYLLFKNLKNFFEKTEYWLLEPQDNLLSEGYCLANPGKEYVVFLNRPKPFSLTITALTKPLKAEWYQPYTNKRMDAGEISNGTFNLEAPLNWNDGPVVLHIH